ncbi:MAG: DUF58 domain-containing protein, partial [Phycisphaerae bacterium]
DADRMTKWAYAATVAASLAHLVVAHGDAVGLTLFDTAVRAQAPVTSSRASLEALTSLMETSTPRNPTDLKLPFHELAGRIPRRGMVVILSDLLTDVDAAVDGLQRFRYGRHDVIMLHILDHDELEFPFMDRTLFEGMEHPDVEILTDPQSLRGTYLATLQAFLRRVRRACLDHRIDYALLSTADPIDVALTRFLAARMHLIRAKA